MMKTTLNTRSILNTLMALAVVSAIALPMMATASTANVSIAYDKTELESVKGQKHLYAKLKDASLKLCGTSEERITGSLTESVENSECYEGTLTAAVKRLDHPAITALHTN
ncbi:UrcA family protein [Pseudomonadota bacterium]